MALKGDTYNIEEGLKDEPVVVDVSPIKGYEYYSYFTSFDPVRTDGYECIYLL
jgi:hypothetical protein